MSGFRVVRGFEDVWRPPSGPRRTPEAVLAEGTVDQGQSTRARLSRLVRHAPEVMVKVSGRTRDPSHLRAHLDYISRNGVVDLEDRDGVLLTGRDEVRDLAEDWSAVALVDSRRRASTPFSVSIVLSMPAGIEAVDVRDAARAFAHATFADRFDYVFATHTDAAHPHVHLTIRALGDRGERLNPKKADLAHWRGAFARALRDRGVEAEATPRRTRGVTLKGDRAPLAHLQRRHEAARAEVPQVRKAAYLEAARAAFQADAEPRPWETNLSQRQAHIRRLYRAQAATLRLAPDPADQALGRAVETFIDRMPQPDTQRLALARLLRSANARLPQDRDNGGVEKPDRERT